MLEHLGKKLENFEGIVGQTRCFAHTLNLTAKAILKQFDVPKTDNDSLDNVAQTLSNLELEDDDKAEREALQMEDNDDSDKGLTDAEWVRLREELLEEGIDDWDEAVQPVRSTLVKVRTDHKDSNPMPKVITNATLSCGNSLLL